MTRRASSTIAATVALAVAVTTGVATIATRPPTAMTSATPGASASPRQSDRSAANVGSASGDSVELARAFLDQWVESGRVVRRDQGGDTVSEGQAYGLLAAVVAHDEKRFDSVWSWTTTHLQRSDGLLAWRWADGKVVDEQPATDADLDTARALVLAGQDFSRPDLTKAGTALAGRIADRLTATTSLGRILLPGLWAAGQEPYAYNPSYASPAAFAVLGRATGDPRWTELEAGSAAVTAKILDSTALPSDWAQVHADGTVDPMPGPAGHGGPVAYGYDAARLPLRYGESCSAPDRALAARFVPTLAREKSPAAVLDLGGGPLAGSTSPLMLASRAAAYSAAGEASRARTDLRSADRLADRQPTYYGRAWAMLAAAMIDGTSLGGCSAEATS